MAAFEYACHLPPNQARKETTIPYIYLAPRVRTRELPMLLARALLGVRRSGALEIVSAQELSIDMPNARHVRVALDGEITTMTTPLHYRTWPEALKVLLPPA